MDPTAPGQPEDPDTPPPLPEQSGSETPADPDTLPALPEQPGSLNASPNQQEPVEDLTPLDIGGRVQDLGMGSACDRGDQRSCQQWLAYQFMKLGLPIKTLSGEVKTTWPAQPGTAEVVTFGVPVPEWQVQAMGAKLNGGQPGMKWSEFSDLINEQLKTNINWEEALKDISKGIAAGNFNAWVAQHEQEVGPLTPAQKSEAYAWKQRFNGLAVRPDALLGQDEISVPQAYIILKMIAGELILQDPSNLNTEASVQMAPEARQQVAIDGPCTFTKREETIVSGGEAVIRIFQSQVLKYLVKVKAINESVLSYVAGANLLSDTAEMLISLFAMEVRMDIDKKPLVRTESTTVPGEEGNVSVLITYAADWGTYLNCLRLAMQTAGINGVTVPNGPAQVSFTPRGRLGFDERCGGLVSFRISNTVLRTDQEGKANVGVIGRVQQKELIGEVVRANQTVEMGIVTSLQDNNLMKDITKVAGAAGGPSSIISAALGIPAKVRFITYYKKFEVSNPRIEGQGGAAGGFDPEC
jgi:hypothetical protein